MFALNLVRSGKVTVAGVLGSSSIEVMTIDLFESEE